MVLSRSSGSASLGPRAPWHSLPVERAAFCVLWTTGPDTALDGVLRLQALRPGDALGTCETFDRWCNPFEGGDESRAAAQRIEREFGIGREELARCPHAARVWAELEEFLGDRPLVVSDCESFEGWRAHFTGPAPASREEAGAPAGFSRCIGLSEMAGLFFPGRLAQRREALVAALTERGSAGSAEAFGPLELRSALYELAARILGRPEDVLRVCVSGYMRAWNGIMAAAPRAGDRLMLALALIDRPSAWSGGVATHRAGLSDGRLAACFEHEIPLEDLLETLAPRCTRETERWAGAENLPPDREEPLAFDAADQALLEEVFRTHLPALFAAEEGAPSYRAGQHDVARAVAGALGTRELLLVHAPTGTGKTLAYLVPAMLWARRHEIRIGVATYTRALQEQAMDREVPRALAALARAGFASGVRVSVLKGRENYLCWRALKLALPDEDEDDGETWLTWTLIALFGLSEIDGDLDRMPLRCPLPLEDSASWLKALTSLLRQVRAQTACCTHRDDRETCAAEVARRRAEQSHVVITNQAFALARQEFFKHLVFDECEHLHEQAHSAWSHSVSLRSIRALLSRLHASRSGSSDRASRRDDGARSRRGGGRALLDRLERMVLEGTPSHVSIAHATAKVVAAQSALGRLEIEIEHFVSWRTEKARERGERDDHSLLREFVGSAAAPGAPGSEGLVDERRSFAQHAHELDATLAELAERLDALPLRGLPRLRRTLEILRADLLEIINAVEAWIPLDEGFPAFRPRTFYDVELDARGDTVLASRVLLPNEFLGRSYYPSLSTGIFLSATTWLQESFEPARAYLGLDRAAEPAGDEDRPPSVVHTFRAPDVFDYRRVLVLVPRDAPSILAGKDAFLDYVRRFLAHLGERTRGRMLVLFTNAQDTLRVGEELAGFFRARRIPLWFQNMEGTAKEEISELFRSRVDSVLLGVDTFWYGADFPGETLEYLVIVKLPYGVPDRYHHAQCAALGAAEQRRRIYLPRALAKFRQGFGRLMRRESDRGCVFILDGRVLEPRHRFFLKELPIAGALDRASSFGSDRAACAGGGAAPASSRARLVRGDTDRCIHEALVHMDLLADVKRRGLDWSFAPGAEPKSTDSNAQAEAPNDERTHESPRAREYRREVPLDIPFEDLPF